MNFGSDLTFSYDGHVGPSELTFSPILLEREATCPPPTLPPIPIQMIMIYLQKNNVQKRVFLRKCFVFISFSVHPGKNLWFERLKYGTDQSWSQNMVQYRTRQHNTVQYGTMQLNMAQYGTIRQNVPQCSTIWYNRAQCRTIWQSVPPEIWH